MALVVVVVVLLLLLIIIVVVIVVRRRDGCTAGTMARGTRALLAKDADADDEQSEQREDLHADAKKFRELLPQLREHNAKLGEKIAARESESAEQRGALAALEGECGDLAARVGSQELSADDAARMHAERERLQGDLDAARAARKSHEQALWEREMSLTREVEQLEASASSFNARLRALHLAPAGAKNGDRVAFGDLPVVPPAAPSAVQKKKLLEKVIGFLKTDGDGVATVLGKKFALPAGPVTAPGMPDAAIS